MQFLQGMPALAGVAAAVLELTITGPTSPPHRADPVDTTRAQIVALLPISIPRNAPNNVAGRQTLDSLLQVVLIRSGFEVLSPDVVQPVWRRLADSVHGFYDPATGELLIDKWAGASGALARELGAWGVLHSKVEVITVRYEGARPVEYDGVTESIGPNRGEGGVGALTLTVVVFDSSGVPVQCGRSGIQLLAKASVWDGAVRPVKPEMVFTDLTRDVAAIERGLGGLLHDQPACGP